MILILTAEGRKDPNQREMVMTMAGLTNGEEFTVKRVTVPREIGKRLADMGFVRGAKGRVVRSALLGDPIQVKICRYDVSIRRAEAEGVEVEVAESAR